MSGGREPIEQFFWRRRPWGHDTITDFNRAEGDCIEFYDVAGLDTFSQLNVVNSGDGVDVSYGADSIHLSGVTAAQAQSDWFIL